jgi:hypothetical protein
LFGATDSKTGMQKPHVFVLLTELIARSKNSGHSGRVGGLKKPMDLLLK